MTSMGKLMTEVKDFDQVDLATPENWKVGREIAHAQARCLDVGDGCFMPCSLQKSWALCFEQSENTKSRDMSLR